MSRRQRAVGVVVDASIARAAGPGDRPPAPACLQALQAMLEAGLFAAVCDELHDEWRRHGSREFNRWRKQMHSRRLVRKIALTRLDEYVAHARRKRGRATGVLAAILKDLHLAVAAIESDRRVLSGDDRIRRHFIGLEHPEIDKLLWGDPCSPTDDTAGWLLAGAPSKRERLLGSQRSPRA